mmetsp:Transcript_6447/g.11509  ORF Transcript_6447/g.11509 Transcript_6447/m.11509 type:complete len:110 (-) Transcript_6447:105-434(-)
MEWTQNLNTITLGLGSDNGIAQLLVKHSSASFNVWRVLTGKTSFVLWRSLYWTKLLSASSRLSLVGKLIKPKLHGRVVVEPVLKRAAALRQPVESFGAELKRNNAIRIL